MNKKYIPGVIVVEGSHDASKVSLLYETTFVITNGYQIPEPERKFLKALKNDVQVIVLTDKDEAGKKIREELNSLRSNIINIEIEAPKPSKKKGVAECDIKDIKTALDKHTSNKRNLKEHNLYELGLFGKENSNELRKKISNTFNLGLINRSNIESRLNMLEISEEKLRKEINNETSR